MSGSPIHNRCSYTIKGLLTDARTSDILAIVSTAVGYFSFSTTWPMEGGPDIYYYTQKILPFRYPSYFTRVHDTYFFLGSGDGSESTEATHTYHVLQSSGSSRGSIVPAIWRQTNGACCPRSYHCLYAHFPPQSVHQTEPTSSPSAH